MTYAQAIAFIHDAGGKGKKNGHVNMLRMLEALGNPHTQYACVHVAGTNGKGSICAYMHAALRAQGYQTGLYTSPFLQRFNERIRLNGTPVSDRLLARGVTTLEPIVQSLRAQGVLPTEFEIGTALAFWCFAQEAVQVAIIEVGIGGLLDATNCISPRVCVVGSIGLDHTGLLGETLPQIAWQKAGIFKPGVPAVTQQAPPEVDAVFEQVSGACGAPWVSLSDARLSVRMDARGAAFDIAAGDFSMEDVRISLPGEHQARNAATALVALDALARGGFEVSQAAMRQGLLAARWPGRLEWLDRECVPILLDGAHNAQGMQALCAYVASGYNRLRVVALYGMCSDKINIRVYAALTAMSARIVVTRPDSHRAVAPQLLAQELALYAGGPEGKTHGPTHVHICEQPAAALERAIDHVRAIPGGVLVVCGSLYLAGEIRTRLGCAPGSIP